MPCKPARLRQPACPPAHRSEPDVKNSVIMLMQPCSASSQHWKHCTQEREPGARRQRRGAMGGRQRPNRWLRLA